MADENLDQQEQLDGPGDDAAGEEKKEDSGGCGLTCLVLIGYLAVLGLGIAIAVILVNYAKA